MNNYYFYNLLCWTFLGDTKDQIINTVKHYNSKFNAGIDIPLDSEITQPLSIEIICVLPLFNPNHFFEANVIDNVFFRINANAFHHVQELAFYYETLKQGDLYELNTAGFGGYFVPEAVVKALKEYDWKKHEKQVRAWLLERYQVLSDAEKKGFFHRLK
ncbi:hypothetical protein HYV79_01565 [Candidatus Woesearchaeota archaeon]|nr:hypothetical protein [Candidatus Woesearchaeota archaeon]